MEIDRFDALSQAWGGEVAAWPSGDQRAARELSVRAPDATHRVLAAARELDHWLDASPSVAPSYALRTAVIAAAPRPRRGLRAATAWLSGVGLAAACAAGVTCGVVATQPAGHDRATEALIQAASELGGSSPVDLGGRDAA